jgi:hypothetical protein
MYISLLLETMLNQSHSDFISGDSIVACTLLGVLSSFELKRSEDGALTLEKVWTKDVSGIIAKVNALVGNENYVIVGGITQDGKGVTQVYSL